MAVGLENIRSEADKQDLFELGMTVQKGSGFSYGDSGGLVQGIAVDAAADGWKGNGSEPPFTCQRKTFAVARSQLLRLPLPSA